MKVARVEHMTLRLVLFLAGLGIVWLGANVAFGGIATLGWQGPSDFVAVTDRAAFGVHDNHVRFLGGVWLGLGAVMTAGAFWVQRLRDILAAFCLLIFIGGLSRIGAADPSILFAAPIAQSLAAEVILFPLLGLWVQLSTKAATHD